MSIFKIIKRATMNENNNMDEFVKKILQIQQEKKETKLNTKDLSDIAQELGVSLEALNQEILIYQQRGAGFLKYENYEDAIAALEHAYTLNPENLETLKLSSQTYYLAWKHAKQQAHKAKALERAEELLGLQADSDFAFALISKIKKIEKNPALANQKDDFLVEEKKTQEKSEKPEGSDKAQVKSYQVKKENSNTTDQKYQIGDKVKVGGYDASIVAVGKKLGQYKIRYKGYDSSWDEWVDEKDITK